MAMVNKKVKPNDVEKVQLYCYNDYPKRFDQDHDDLMVIIAAINNYIVKRILVDQGSSANILYSATTTSMNISKVDLKPYNGNLIDFSGKQVPMEGMIKLRVGNIISIICRDSFFYQ